MITQAAYCEVCTWPLLTHIDSPGQCQAEFDDFQPHEFAGDANYHYGQASWIMSEYESRFEGVSPAPNGVNEDVQTIMADLLGDLWHFAERHDIDMDKAWDDAQMNWQEESAETYTLPVISTEDEEQI